MDTIIKKLLEANLLFPGYEKDLQFLESASRLFSTGTFKDKMVLDNYLEGMDDETKVHKVTNWYVLLRFIPYIISPEIKAIMLNHFEQWDPLWHNIDEETIDVKIPEFWNTPSNIRWF